MLIGKCCFCNSSRRGWAGGAQVHAGGGDSVEEPVHGGAQCEEYAGGGSVQLGEVRLRRGLSAGLAGGRRGSSNPAGKHKEGASLIISIQGDPSGGVLHSAVEHPLLNSHISHISGSWCFKQNGRGSRHWNIKSSHWFQLSHYHGYLTFTTPTKD